MWTRAGGDLEWLLAQHRDSRDNKVRVSQAFYKRFLSLRSLPVPVVAAINGPAVGAWLCLAQGCDLRVAAHSASIGATFTRLGLHLDMAATHFLPGVAGLQAAAELLLTEHMVTAQEALALGLVARLEEDVMASDVN